MLHQITERSINMKILDHTDETVLARGSILDQVHNIAIELVINIDTLKIQKVQGQMVKVPFQTCEPALENLKEIIGMKLDSGISQRIANAVGGKNGCVHLSEVVVETTRLAANTIFGIKCGGKEWRAGILSDDEFWRRVKPLLKGTCRIFQDDNDQ